MILDSEKQRKLLLAIILEHIFSAPGRSLKAVAAEIDSLENLITHAPLAGEGKKEKETP